MSYKLEGIKKIYSVIATQLPILRIYQEKPRFFWIEKICAGFFSSCAQRDSVFPL